MDEARSLVRRLEELRARLAEHQAREADLREEVDELLAEIEEFQRTPTRTPVIGTLPLLVRGAR